MRLIQRLRAWLLLRRKLARVDTILVEPDMSGARNRFRITYVADGEPVLHIYEYGDRSRGAPLRIAPRPHFRLL